jgi:DNA-binding CsgD family transcriptional regulator
MAKSQRVPNRNPDQLVLSLVDDIYSAALDPNLWQGVMKHIVEAAGGASGQLVSPTENILASLWAPYGFDPNVMVSYAQYYHALDVWTQAGDAMTIPTCQAVTGEQLIDFHEFKRSEYFNDFLKPREFERIVCCFIAKPQDGPKTSLTVYRPPGSEPFGQEAVKLLNAIAPHVRRAAQLHWRIHDLEHQQATNTAVLDHLGTGVALVDEGCCVTYLNLAAEAIVNRNDGLSVSGGQLTAALGSETAELSCLLGEATRATISLARSRTNIMKVSRHGTRCPYQVSVLPVPLSGAFPVGRRRTAAIVFISDAQLSRRTSLDLIAQVYALTPAEVRLLGPILEGESLKEAARTLGISVNTVHAQLNSIFTKTGTHKQVQLANLVMSMIGVARG